MKAEDLHCEFAYTRYGYRLAKAYLKDKHKKKWKKIKGEDGWSIVAYANVLWREKENQP